MTLLVTLSPTKHGIDKLVRAGVRHFKLRQGAHILLPRVGEVGDAGSSTFTYFNIQTYTNVTGIGHGDFFLILIDIAKHYDYYNRVLTKLESSFEHRQIRFKHILNSGFGQHRKCDFARCRMRFCALLYVIFRLAVYHFDYKKQLT
jgi:hypothetical protein